MENQFKGYNNVFAKTLRYIIEEHPHTGEKTTQKALAKAIGIRPQTVSLYMDGSTQPNADNLYKIAKFFQVSVDYLLTGISSENKKVHETLGLSEEAVNLIKRAHKTDHLDTCTEVIPILDELLSDLDFYRFLEYLAFKMENLKNLIQMPQEEKEKVISGLNVEGYWTWDLNIYIQDFILKELKKRGLSLGKI